MTRASCGLALAASAVAAMVALGVAQETQERAATSEEQSEGAQQPVFRTGINFVRVDVIVTDDDGNPVTDLTAEDFEILEDGHPQTVETFRLVHLTGAPEPDAEPIRAIRTPDDAEREVARDDTRVFVIFLDDYHVRDDAGLRVREPLIRFLSQQLSPTDLVAVMYPLTPLDAVTLTRDRDAIIRTVSNFVGRKYDYEPRNQFEVRYARYPAITVERIRNQVTLSALEGLAIHLGGLGEGRKSIILVSEGFTGMLPPQLRDPVAAYPGYDNPNYRNPMAATDSPAEQYAEMVTEMDLDMEMRRVWDAANKSNTAIYALDPRGLGVFEFGVQDAVDLRTDVRILRSTMDTLRVLADQTDGQALLNSNDLSQGLRQVVRDSSTYYLLGYNSTEAPTDGRFHEITVRVRRPGVEVRARRGYWALSEDDARRAEDPTPTAEPSPELQDALSALARPRSGRVVDTWIGTARGADGRTRVTFAWAPSPVVPGQRRDEPARVSLMASGDVGGAYFRGHVPDPGVSPARDPAGGPGPSQVVFDADPGTVRMRIAVEGEAGEVLDTEFQELEIPDFASVEVALSTPMLFRAANAYEMRQLVGNPQAAPATSREFRRTEILLIRFEAYGPGGSPPGLGARLLTRRGDAMHDVEVPPPGPDGRYEIQLPLSGLMPGDYILELEASGDGPSAKELIALRISS